MSYQAVVFDLFGTLVNNFFTANYRKYITDTAAALSLPRVVHAGEPRDSFAVEAQDWQGSVINCLYDIIKLLERGEQDEKNI